MTIHQQALFSGEMITHHWPFGGLEPWSFDLLMADPPWHFDLYSQKGMTKSPQAQYSTMSIDEIAAMPVDRLAAPNCLLWLWCTWPLLPQQIEVMGGWGFRYVTGGAWNKVMWGPGYRLRSLCEPFLIGIVGRPQTDSRSIPNFFRERRREHSRKPEQAYRACERMMPAANRLELFSRTPRDGWTAWGAEQGKFAA